MVTADSVKTKLQGLIDTANAATGNADADLTAAVNALVAGFGQGGGALSEITVASTIANGAELKTYWESIGETGTCMYIRPDWAEIIEETDVCFAVAFVNGAVYFALRWRNKGVNNPTVGSSAALVNIPAGTVFARLEM